MPQYSLNHLSKRFGGMQALDDVTLCLRAGEFVVVLGPTGSGKTTLLRTMCGLEPADSGRILEDQIDITALTPPARDMAMVFQNFSLYPRMSVYQNLAFPLQSARRKIAAAEVDRRVKWAAEMLGIADKLQRQPAELSGGQQQRVAIGRAIVREPKLFLFDEPLASLDAKLREQMAVELHRLQRRLNVTMLYVTHDQTEAMGLADRIVVLDRGQVLQIGTPDEIYNHPVSPRVARMLGSPPINLLEAAPALALTGTATGIVGVRPEHLAVAADIEGTARCIVTEHLGPTTTLVLEFAGVHLRASYDPGVAIEVGQRCNLKVDPARILRWPAVESGAYNL